MDPLKDLILAACSNIYSSPKRKQRRMNKPNPDANWWEVADLPSFPTRFDDSWPSLGMNIKALFGAAPTVEKNYKACLKDEDSFEDLWTRFEKEFPELRTVHADLALYKKRETERKWVTRDSYTRLYFDGDTKIEATVVTNDAKFLDRVITWLAANTSKILPKGRVSVLVSTNEGPEFHNMGVAGQPVERGNYEAEVLKGYDRIVTDLKSSEPGGRVAIMDGKPGTGKTFLIRGLISEVPNVMMVIIQAGMIEQLTNPSLLPALISLHRDNGARPIVFIIEDADECLAPRDGSNMSAISAVLNLGDGILGKLLDIRIVATTNAKRQAIDEAILRPGRLSAAVRVDGLGGTRASEIYTRLTGKPAPTGMSGNTLAEVYSRARNDGWEPPKLKKGVGFRQGKAEETPDGDDDMPGPDY